MAASSSFEAVNKWICFNEKRKSNNKAIGYGNGSCSYYVLV
jgi:hypothetical protein